MNSQVYFFDKTGAISDHSNLETMSIKNLLVRQSHMRSPCDDVVTAVRSRNASIECGAVQCRMNAFWSREIFQTT